MRIDHLIAGQSVAGADYFQTVNPATQEVLAEVAQGGEAEVNAAVAAAKDAFPKWANTPAPERARLIRKLGDLIAMHVPEIAQTETNDCGQTISQTGKQLVPRAADNFHYFAEMCTRVDGHTYPTPTHLNYTLFHPVGVCALISPWNVPFMTATWKVAPCLAFGNTAVLKMSELSPLSAARLGELALEAGIPAGVLNLVHGYGKDAGEPLVAHPDVRAISFTGSTATGNRIVKAAGLKKFSMELGGKSPFVVFDDADLARALDAAVFMIFSNNGERCTAGSRILVQQSIYADFVAKFVERAKKITVGDPLDEKTIVGPMISQGHLAKVRSYIELGPKEGATLLCGGLDTPAGLPDRVKKGNFVAPTVFADVDNRMRIAQEEIFELLAAELHASEKARTQVEHFSKRFPEMRIQDGYEISRAWMKLKLAEGRVVKGHKIGLTSRAMQQASQITEPDYGTLLDDMFFEPGDIPAERFIAPRVEVELAFVLKDKIEGEATTVEDVLAATEYVQPAIEIIDSRIEQFDRHTKVMRKVYDTISDNAANAGIILGGRRVHPSEVDLPWCGAVLRQNGVVEETGLAAGVQGHPAVGIAWLAQKLAPWGEALLPGQVVLAGSFTRPVAAKRGDVFDADYGQLGRFEFRFV